jgi:hypothetical protein
LPHGEGALRSDQGVFMGPRLVGLEMQGGETLDRQRYQAGN